MVEWKKLGDLCDIGTGSNNREDACENGSYPFFVRSKEVLRIDSYLFDEEAILIPGEGGIGEIFHYIKGKYGLHQRTYRVHPKSKEAIGRFIYYFLFEHFGNYINKKSYKSTAASIRKPMLIDFQIPVLSISEQNRIVGILDTFTDSIENLKKQIAQRRKQYEFYRDQLLNLEGKEEVEWKELKSTMQVLRGKRLTKNLLSEDADYYVFHGGLEPLGKYSNYNREANTVMVINVGASAGTVGYSADKFWSSDGCFAITHCDEILSRFLYYFLQSKTHYLQSQVRHAGIPTLDNAVVEKIRIPILSIEKQQRIVSLLDTFEASISNLEAQLEQRQKQYEYYRNKLLTFE